MSYGVRPPPGSNGVQSGQPVKLDQANPSDGLTGFLSNILKMMISSSPNQKTGIDCPTNAKKVAYMVEKRILAQR